jgi:hypothetical protein
MTDRDPNIVNSALSREVTQQGGTVRVDIYRLEDEPRWSLEVVNDRGTSTVWDDLFDTDADADAAFRAALVEEGIEAFLDSAKVIPFRR